MRAEAGHSILLTGTTAAGAVSSAFAEKREELKQRFPSFFAPVPRLGYALRDSRETEREQLAAENAAAAFGYSYLRRVGSEGLLAALWDLGEAAECGLWVELKKIPIRQETIEICEYLGVNPYEADSAGACLIAAPDGFRLHLALQDAGIPNALIGILTPGTAKILTYPGHIRYIDRPR